MLLIDLFSGVGGLSSGFASAGFSPILAIENNSTIARAYAANNAQADLIVDDISTIELRKVMPKNVGESLVIVGGPPCQGFSQKGKRIGLKDERNFLFRKFVEAVAISRPRAFVIENVPGLLSSQNGYFLTEISEAFSSYGYSIFTKVLDASEFGVPQVRRRAVIVGLRGLTLFSWPQSQQNKVTVWDALSDLPKLKSGEGSEPVKLSNPAQSSFQKEMRRNSESLLFNHIATNHSDIALERLKLIPAEGTKASLPPEHLTKSNYSGTWCRLKWKEPARTITTRFDTPSSGMFTLPDQDRCLTVREAARLQSFPDTFRFSGTKSAQMLQVGNAVPPILARHLAQSLAQSLD